MMVGIVDADLLASGTRHPNLALLKIAGFLHDNGVKFELIFQPDERMLAESPHGEEMAEMLSRARLHGDVIFAFDNWKDRDTIERALVVWRKYNPTRSTKFYLFTGFRQQPEKQDAFWRDVWELFARIKVLMKHRCLGYVMRHEDYHRAPLPNIYTQVARWVNQPAFYKKQSFWQFCYRNQSLWEERNLPELDRPALKTFDEFMADVDAGFYDTTARMTQPLRTVLDMLAMFPERRDELLDMFNTRMPPPAIKTAR